MLVQCREFCREFDNLRALMGRLEKASGAARPFFWCGPINKGDPVKCGQRQSLCVSDEAGRILEDLLRMLDRRGLINLDGFSEPARRLLARRLRAEKASLPLATAGPPQAGCRRGDADEAAGGPEGDGRAERPV